jgi:hypothetical protein
MSPERENVNTQYRTNIVKYISNGLKVFEDRVIALLISSLAVIDTATEVVSIKLIKLLPSGLNVTLNALGMIIKRTI